jgi:hypothetical protein
MYYQTQKNKNKNEIKGSFQSQQLHNTILIKTSVG